MGERTHRSPEQERGLKAPTSQPRPESHRILAFCTVCLPNRIVSVLLEAMFDALSLQIAWYDEVGAHVRMPALRGGPTVQGEADSIATGIIDHSDRVVTTAVDIQTVRVDLAAAYRIAASAGYDDVIWNHFSARVPRRDDRFLVKPHGLTFDEVTASNLVVVDDKGRVVEGDGYVEESAFQLHAQIHRTRTDAACALHAHPPYATALTSLRDNRLRFVHQDSLHFYGRVAYHDGYNGLALDTQEAATIVGALADKDVLFMRHHGVIVIGRDVADAYYHLYYLELAAKRQLLAMSSNQELVDISEDIAQLVGKQFEDERGESAALNFTALKRRLDQADRGYAN